MHSGGCSPDRRLPPSWVTVFRLGPTRGQTREADLGGRAGRAVRRDALVDGAPPRARGGLVVRAARGRASGAPPLPGLRRQPVEGRLLPAVRPERDRRPGG